MTAANPRPLLILFAAGMNLVLLQVAMVRELASVFFCSELVILAVTVALLGGCSLGYLVSDRLDASLIGPWLAAAIVLHLPMVAGVRVVVVALGESGLSAFALPLVLVATALALTSCYTVLLPRLIADEGGGVISLARCYSAELVGAAFGGLAAAAVGSWLGFVAVAFLYQALLVVIVALLGMSRRVIVSVTLAGILVLALMPSLDRWSTELLYQQTRGIEGARLLHREVSPYQKVEVFESSTGERSLYLNGLEYFNSSDLEHFNRYLSGVPARLVPSDASVLVVGSGSMASVAYVAPHVGEITTVELDPAVAAAGQRWFADRNHLDEIETPWRLVIDDAKHFLATTEQHFDLIIVDVPAPWYVQTGLLFTREFYELARNRLRAEGVLSVYLTEPFRPGDSMVVASQILAAIVEVFDSTVVLDAPESPYGFVLSSQGLLEVADVRAAVAESSAEALPAIYSRDEVMPIIAGATPTSFDNLGIVWHLNLGVLSRELQNARR